MLTCPPDGPLTRAPSLPPYPEDLERDVLGELEEQPVRLNPALTASVAWTAGLSDVDDEDYETLRMRLWLGGRPLGEDEGWDRMQLLGHATTASGRGSAHLRRLPRRRREPGPCSCASTTPPTSRTCRSPPGRGPRGRRYDRLVVDARPYLRTLSCSSQGGLTGASEPGWHEEEQDHCDRGGGCRRRRRRGTAVAASDSSDAVRAVQTASQGVSHKAYDLERDRNRWEVKFADGTERDVSLDGRRVTATRRDDDRSRRVAAARVSLASALKTAAARGNGTLTDAEIDTTRAGALVWSVSFERSDDDETEVLRRRQVRARAQRRPRA